MLTKKVDITRDKKLHILRDKKVQKECLSIETKQILLEAESFKVRCHTPNRQGYLTLFLLSSDGCEVIYRSKRMFNEMYECMVQSSVKCKNTSKEQCILYALVSSCPLPEYLFGRMHEHMATKNDIKNIFLTKRMIQNYDIFYKKSTLTFYSKPQNKETPQVEEHSDTFYEKEEHTLVDILYGTDRGYEESLEVNYQYTTQRSQLSFGVAQVSIPKSHIFGKVERPMFRFKREDEIGKDISLYTLEPLKKKKFSSLLENKLTHAKKEDILIFIHGFNVSFAGALRRTAQLVYDLKFKGIPLTYSWASQGSPNKYLKDEVSVQYTIPKLVTFLQEVIKNKGNAKIHILAHSMGTLALSNALRDISFLYDTPQFENIIYAAPDIDVDVFESNFYPYIKKTTDKITIYASSNDKALTASRILHDDKRLGEGGEYLSVFADLVMIDVTGIDTSMIGHSYFANKKMLVNDLRSVVKKSLPPIERSNLVSKHKNHLEYWEFIA